MRIYAPTSAAAGAPSRAPRRSAGGAFSVGEAETGRPLAQAAGPRAVASLDALLALQGFDDPGERRRRTVRRGRSALDVLDELKTGLLAGTLDPGALARLQVIAATLLEDSGDPRLDAVMAGIELRAAVEIAKYARR